MVTTLGTKGSVLIGRTSSQKATKQAPDKDAAAEEVTEEAVLEDLLTSMLADVASSDSDDTGNSDSSLFLGCTARDGTQIKQAPDRA